MWEVATMEGWRTALVVQGVTRGGRAVPVVAGLLETPYGPLVGIRVGERGESVILSDQVGAELIVNLREAIATKLKAEGEL
ncbi:MAG: hypothetical protein GEU98_26010 [Pseudonocardiaceae bacterium]|nr:hypothetical protein [Pseudonocardiaceae bacterium]